MELLPCTRSNAFKLTEEVRGIHISGLSKRQQIDFRAIREQRNAKARERFRELLATDEALKQIQDRIQELMNDPQIPDRDRQLEIAKQQRCGYILRMDDTNLRAIFQLSQDQEHEQKLHCSLGAQASEAPLPSSSSLSF